MSLRSIGVRHCRRAFAPLVRQPIVRALSTDIPPTPSANEALLDRLARQNSNDSGAYDLYDLVERADGEEEVAQAVELSQFEKKHIASKNLKRITSSLGSVAERRYSPDDLIKNPPSAKDITLELLMSSQTHMGHNASLWNPANSRYIHGVRQGIHIISLETTAAHLRRAARVVEEVSYRGGLILFVGTRKGQMQIVTKAAKLAGGCHLFTKWTPGSITNRDVLLKDQEMAIVDENDQNLDGFDKHLRERRPLLPDLVVCLNPRENFVMLYECGLRNIPTIGVIDTDTDPTWVTYTIPANDDSLRSVAVVAGVLGRAGEKGRKRRLESASAGEVLWETPPEVRKYISVSRMERMKAIRAQQELIELRAAEEEAEEIVKAEEEMHEVARRNANLDAGRGSRSVDDENDLAAEVRRLLGNDSAAKTPTSKADH